MKLEFGNIISLRKILILLLTCSVTIIGNGQSQKNEVHIDSEIPALSIHYLGHSAFVLQFDNGISVVTDYGHFNAWAPDWDSPVYDIGELVPNVMTYSHLHADHYDPDRIPQGVEYILTELDSLEIDGLKITPIRVCENNINTEDNSAYLFSYKGLKFLHLGDAQAQIMAIQDPVVQNHIVEIIPDSLDVLFMPIEGMQQYIEEAELFIDLLKPKRIIPMHYWSIEYKEEFLSYLDLQNNSGCNYNILDLPSSEFDIFEDGIVEPVDVISLIPSAYSCVTTINYNSELRFKLWQNYPNPANENTKIRYQLPERLFVILTVYNSSGQVVRTILNRFQDEGIHDVYLNIKDLPEGFYFYQLTAGNKYLIKPMIIK